MSRARFLVLPWLAIAGAVALASTVNWVEPPAAPEELQRVRAATWTTVVTSEEPHADPPHGVPQVRTRARTPRPTSVVHARGEAAARLHDLRWEQLARDDGPAPDVAGLAHDARLERMEAELRKVVSRSTGDSSAAALRLGNRARAMLLELSRLRRVGGSAELDGMGAGVEELRTRAELELEAR